MVRDIIRSLAQVEEAIAVQNARFFELGKSARKEAGREGLVPEDAWEALVEFDLGGRDAPSIRFCSLLHRA